MNVALDLTEIVAALREELLDEIHELVRSEVEAVAWPEWLAVETAARYLDSSPERVRKLKDRREIPFHQKGPGCRVFFARRDLDAWMQSYRYGGRT